MVSTFSVGCAEKPSAWYQQEEGKRKPLVISAAIKLANYFCLHLNGASLHVHILQKGMPVSLSLSPKIPKPEPAPLPSP